MTSPGKEYFEDIENFKFDPFELKNILFLDSNSSDKYFYNNIRVVDTQNYFPSVLLSLSEKLHINSKNFPMIYLILSQTGHLFEVAF